MFTVKLMSSTVPCKNIHNYSILPHFVTIKLQGILLVLYVVDQHKVVQNDLRRGFKNEKRRNGISERSRTGEGKKEKDGHK